MKRILTLMLGLVSNLLSAQDGIYVPGYVVKSDGDTIKGTIWTSLTNRTPATLYFRNFEGVGTQFTPSDLQSFYLETTQRLFIPKTVGIDRKPESDDHVNIDNLEPKLERATIFVMVIVKGNANLYYHKDSRHHYFLEKADSIEELLQIRYTTSGKSYRTLQLYKEQLKKFFEDCPRMRKEDVEYTTPALTSRVVEYNTCKSGKSGTSFQYDAGLDSVKFIPSIVTGFACTVLNYSGDDNGVTNFVADKAKFNVSASPVIGIGLESNPRRSHPGASVALQVFYRNVAFTSTVSDANFKHDITFAYSFVRANLMLRLSEPHMKPARFFVAIGPTAGVSFSEKNNLTQRQHTNNDALVYTGVVKDVQTIDAGLTVGGGVMFRRLRAELRLEGALKSNKQLTPPISLGRLYTTSYMFMLSYAFVK